MFRFLGSYSPGAIWLRAKQTYGHGLRTTYYRDYLRPKILRRAPIKVLTDETCEIHVLTSKADWMSLLWVLHSFYLMVPIRFKLCIHEDGSLSDAEAAELQRHFPDARVIRRAESDRVAAVRLEDYPRCAEFRNFHSLALKVTDFNLFLESDRMLILDSDILFFEEPVELLRRLIDPAQTKNTLNMDWSDGYSLSEEVIRRELPDFPFVHLINSGLGLIHRSSIRFDWAEQILSVPGVLDRRHCVEQTIIALCSARYGFEPLPEPYAVTLKSRTVDQPVKHYTSPIRHLMYRQGIADLKSSLL